MNNIVETYLMFKANNIFEYIEILAKEKRMVSRLPRTLDKLIYKYYDLFVLSSEKISYDWLVEETGLKDTKERLILFYLLIEFDFASKTEYRDSNYYNFYNFLVNSIIFFRLLDEAVGDSFSDKILKVINGESIILESDYILLLNQCNLELEKTYYKIIKIENKFSEEFNFPMYDVKFSKVKNSDNLYFNKFKYINSDLSKELKKDIKYINDEFEVKLFFANLNISFLRLYHEVNKELIVFIPDDVISKKVNYNLFLDFVKLRFLKERVNFVVNSSLLENYQERIVSLISNNINILLYLDSNEIAKDYLQSIKYLVINNKKIDSKIKYATENNLEVIVINPDKEDIKRYCEIMYVT